MELMNRLHDIFGFEKHLISEMEIDKEIGNDVKDSYSIKFEHGKYGIKASNQRSYLYALYDILNGEKSMCFQSDLIQRGVHLDCGRKYFTSVWIKQLIQAIFEAKLNTIQFHFSENEGFRLEIPKYEHLCSDEFLNLDEMGEILILARQLEINVIPSFDSPGHLKHLLNYYPELRLKGSQTGIDITNPRSRALIKDMYDALLDVFVGVNTFHIGADEFIDFDAFHDFPQLEAFAKETVRDDAQAIDAYIHYVNEMGTYLLEKGLNVQVWNDPFYRTNQSSSLILNPEFTITYWTSWNANMAPVSTFIDKGHEVINYMDSLLYFVLGENAGYTYPTVEKIMNQFEPNRFPNRHESIGKETQQLLDPQSALLGGSMIAIWCDRPEAMTEDHVMDAFIPLVNAFSTKCTKTIKSS